MEEIRYVAPDPGTAFLSLKRQPQAGWASKGDLETTIHPARSRGPASQPALPTIILPHETLVHLASNPAADLARLPSLRGQADSRFGGLLRAALNEGLADPPISHQVRSGIPQATPTEVARLRTLKKWRVNLGNQLSIDPALVWPMVSLERLAKAPRTLGAELRSGEVRQWQREQFATSLGASLVQSTNPPSATGTS